MELMMTKVTPRDRLYWIMRSIFSSVFHFLLNIEIEGQENLDIDGACLVVANHLSALDLPLLYIFFPRRGWALAAEEYRLHPIWGPFLHLIGVIFVQRNKVDRRALRAALRILQEGGVVALHPEGTRSRTGQLQEGKRGAAYLATRTTATIIPVAITGSEKIWSALLRLHRQQVRIVVGQPFTLMPMSGPVRGPQLVAHTDFIMCRLAALLPESYRGFYRGGFTVGD